MSTTTLDNGLLVTLLPTHHIPVTDIRLVIPAARTATALPAAVDVLAAAVLAGSRRTDRTALADRAADVGAVLNASLTPESLVLSATVLSSGTVTALSLLAEVCTAPAYAAGEVDLARGRLAATTGSPQPAARLERQLLRHRFGEHPLTAEPPTSQELLEVTREDVVRTHHHLVVPQGTTLLVTGDFRPTTVLTAVELAFGPWTGPPSHAVRPPFPAHPQAGSFTMHQLHTSESITAVAATSVALDHPDLPSLHLLSLALGGMRSSRLVYTLRERTGRVYGVECGLRHTRVGSWLMVRARSAPRTGHRIAADIHRCINTVAISGITEQEAEAARDYAIGYTDLAISNQYSAANAYAGFLMQGIDPTWPSDFSESLRIVRPHDINAAGKYLRDSLTTGVLDKTPRGWPG
ncbi:M16 family metallopeptidase [Kitasatospora sp. NPDC059827]|uniref:M16 family metallopeptidase n=1 Tax=Kitasatospora sp. NPDC059827 TaxID=3346964 RepID=UPI00365FB3C2